MELWEEVEHLQGKMRNTWGRNPLRVIKWQNHSGSGNHLN